MQLYAIYVFALESVVFFVLNYFFIKIFSCPIFRQEILVENYDYYFLSVYTRSYYIFSYLQKNICLHYFLFTSYILNRIYPVASKRIRAKLALYITLSSTLQHWQWKEILLSSCGPN